MIRPALLSTWLTTCTTVLLVGCPPREDASSQERWLPRLTDECGFAGQQLPEENSDGLIGYVACNSGDDCAIHEHWMSGLRMSLEVDLSGADASEFAVEGEDTSLVSSEREPVLERDRCTNEPRIRQQVLLLAAGEARLVVEVLQGQPLVHDSFTFKVRDPAATLLFATDDPDQEPIGVASGGDAASEIALSAGETAALSMRVLDEDGNALTTLGSELWWVDDPEVLQLAPGGEQHDREDAGAEPPPALPIRGTDVVLTSLREGSTVLHALAGNLEHTLTVQVTER